MPDVETEVRRYVEAVMDQVAPVTADEARKRASRRRIVSRPRWVVLAAVLLGVVGAAAALVVLDTSRQDETTVAVDAPSTLPLTLDGHRDWLIDYFNGAHSPSQHEIEARFTKSFLAEAQPRDLRESAATLSEPGTRWWVLEEVDRRDHLLATQLVGHNADQAQLTIVVADDGRIIDARVQRALACDAVAPDDVTLAPPLAARLQQVLDLLNGDHDITDDEIANTFARPFLEERSPRAIRSWFAGGRDVAPFKLRYFQDEPDDVSLTARFAANNGREGELRLFIEPEAPFRITGLLSQLRWPCRVPED